MKSFLFGILCAAAFLGCSSAPNTQRLPIGERCGDNDACGTVPYSCAITNYPGGYCQKTCATDGDCPADSVCFASECRRSCSPDKLCRTSEGYVCRPGASSPFCDVPTP